MTPRRAAVSSYAKASAIKAFKVAAVLTIGAVAAGLVLLWALSADHDYRTTPICAERISAGCRGQITATVSDVIITNGSKVTRPEYALRLNGRPPANGLVHFTNENNLLDQAGIGDVVQADVWQGQVVRVHLGGTVAGTTRLPGNSVALPLAWTVAAGGFALIFYVYGIGRRLGRFRIWWSQAILVALALPFADFAVAAVALLLGGVSVTFAYVTSSAVIGAILLIGLIGWLIQFLPSGIRAPQIEIGPVLGGGRWQLAVGIMAAAAVLGGSGWWLAEAGQLTAYRAAPSCAGSPAGRTDCRYTLQAEVIRIWVVHGHDSDSEIYLFGDPPANGAITLNSDVVPLSVHVGDTVRALVWHGAVTRVTTASATGTTPSDPADRTLHAWVIALVAAIAAFGFLRWSVRKRNHARLREMTAARFVLPELVTVLCFGFGLTLMGFYVAWGVPALLVGLAVLVYSSVRLPTPTTGWAEPVRQAPGNM